MLIEVVGKNGLKITEAMKNYAEDKISKIEKYFSNGEKLKVRVVCKVYKDHHKVEVSIPSKYFDLRVEVSENTIYSALDVSVDKLERQIKKHKGKINQFVKNRGGDKDYFNVKKEEEDALEREFIAKNIVKKKSLSLTSMTIAEAISNIELIGHDFYLFVNEENNLTSILYVRDDGDYALIETS